MVTDSVAVITPGSGEKVGVLAWGVPGGSPGLMKYVAWDTLLAVPPENVALAKMVTPHGAFPEVLIPLHDTEIGAYVIVGVHAGRAVASAQYKNVAPGLDLSVTDG